MKDISSLTCDTRAKTENACHSSAKTGLISSAETNNDFCCSNSCLLNDRVLNSWSVQ